MRPTKRLLALGVASVLLAACGHKDKDAPLAFVPADTPYVVASLDKLDDSAYEAVLAQLNYEAPGQVAQLKSYAQEFDAKGNADAARLLRAVVAELDGKNAETVLKNVGVDLKTGSAVYGVGLSPVARAALADPAAWDAFVGRLETAYGKKLDTADAGGQAYRHVALGDSGTQLIIATVGKNAVAALLPADAAQPLIRQALGVDRPEKNLQDDGRLADLAKDKGYKDYVVGQVDLTRLLPLVAAGKDPLFASFLKQQSKKTGEPAPQIPASCQEEATRVAARVPSFSFGYTKLDLHHVEQRVDVALASDITSAFSGLKVELPGLGNDATGPFDASIALPVEQIRTFFTTQSEAVAAKPFACPAFASLNDSFAKMGSTMQQAAIPPFGDIRGVRLVVDSYKPGAPGAAIPQITGRVVLATRNPAGLLAMSQAVLGGEFKLAADGKPVALPANLTQSLGMPGWAAMNGQAIAIGLGDGEDNKLDDVLMGSTGDAGRLSRLHLNGDMYRTWVDVMSDKAQQYASAMAEAATADGAPDSQAADTATAQRSKAQFDAMKAQAARVVQVTGEAHMDDKGLVISGAVEYK
ncbi:hypothetical protein [Luteibacter aegosomatissinici]|uniref:hypothetical protein n=1 Tax=Luteibacter aegosomatissinici TaxID=2911539 RepID=UPI001FFA1402|nr:hypothetical protein [Luteibacter aegosomatissinici]UPG93451.1 hypothetical protein L2Y97_16605 [Luteibacter aegosomatissinici]